jgi:hypothetical protein
MAQMSQSLLFVGSADDVGARGQEWPFHLPHSTRDHHSMSLYDAHSVFVVGIRSGHWRRFALDRKWLRRRRLPIGRRQSARLGRRLIGFVELGRKFVGHRRQLIELRRSLIQ